MTTAFIPVFITLTLGNTFNLVKYQKGSVDVFDETMYKGKLQVIDRSFTRSQYKLIESSTQAREFLDMSGDVSLRIKKGDINVEGLGEYLRDTSNRQKFVELLIRVQHETVTETIPSHLKPKLEWMSMLPQEVGTHYVRSITYGGELIASLRLKAKNREEREKIKAAISANLQLTGTFDMNANGSFDKLRKDLTGMYDEHITVIATKGPSSPAQNVEDLMKIVAEYPNEISKIENGKGKALKAELYPLSALRKDFPNYLPNNAINSLLNDVESKYDDIRAVMHDLIPWFTKLGTKITNKEAQVMVKELRNAAKTAQRAFHAAINDLDVSIAGKSNQFEEAFKAYGTGKDNIPNRFQRWFWKLRHIIGKEPILWEKPAGSGAVYINWGSETCPTPSSGTLKKGEVELIYSGRAAGTLPKSWGGGRNYECMKIREPEISRSFAPLPKSAFLDAVNYRKLTNPDKTQPILCAACLVKNTVSAETFYGRTSCPTNWKVQYHGLTMADSSSNIDMDFLCLNKEAFTKETFDEAGNGLSKVNPVWMNCKNCEGEQIVPCVVCSYENKEHVF